MTKAPETSQARETGADDNRASATKSAGRNDHGNTGHSNAGRAEPGNAHAGETAIALADVHLTLGSKAGAVNILKGVSMSVAQGQSLAIVGPSGSGKTSLLMIMAGLERATAGTVNVAGYPFSEMSEDAMAEARGRDVGVVFQAFHLIPTMTALENVALPLELTGRAKSVETATERLGEVGLGDRLQHYPAQLSGGEQQRVALARALAPAPRVLFADEPTGNLDKATGEQVISLLFGLQRRENATLVLVTHDEVLAARCDRVVRMADGRLSETTNEAAGDGGEPVTGQDAGQDTGKTADTVASSGFKAAANPGVAA